MSKYKKPLEFFKNARATVGRRSVENLSRVVSLLRSSVFLKRFQNKKKTHASKWSSPNRVHLSRVVDEMPSVPKTHTYTADFETFVVANITTQCSETPFAQKPRPEFRTHTPYR